MGSREIVREIVYALGPGTGVDDDAPLGAEGLGLDSIAIAEVLLECEMRLGVAVGALLESREPLTITRIADHLETAAVQ